MSERWRLSERVTKRELAPDAVADQHDIVFQPMSGGRGTDKPGHGCFDVVRASVVKIDAVARRACHYVPRDRVERASRRDCQAVVQQGHDGPSSRLQVEVRVARAVAHGRRVDPRRGRGRGWRER